VNAKRISLFVFSVTVSACSFASSDSTDATGVTVAPVTIKAAAAQSVGPFSVPKVGIRVGGGNWNEFMAEGGVDVTFNLPLLPLPAMRVDAEAFGKPGNFGTRHGNDLSLLGIQTFLLGYAGAGVSYYYTDDEGNHESGFGLKALAGLNLPDNCFVEASILVGPSTPPVFVSIGKRF